MSWTFVGKAPATELSLQEALDRVAKLLEDPTIVEEYAPIVQLFSSNATDDNYLNPFFYLDAMKKGAGKLAYFLNDTLRKCEKNEFEARSGPNARSCSNLLKDLSVAIGNCNVVLLDHHKTARMNIYRNLLAQGNSSPMDESNPLFKMLFGSTINNFEEIGRRYRYIARFFKNDPTNCEEESRLRRELLVLLNHAVEVKRDAVFDDETMLEVAESHYKTLLRHAEELASLRPDKDEPARSSGRSEDDLLEDMRAVALDAAKIFHILIKNADSLCDRSDVTQVMRCIELREKIAECFFLSGHLGDAQLYLIGAAHIAHWDIRNDDSQKKDVKNRLTKALARVKDAISPTSQSSPPKSTAAQVGRNWRHQRQGAEDDDIARTARSDPNLWLALHTARADGSVVKYCAAHEEILAATNKATKTYIKGVAIAAVAVAAPVAGIGGSAAVALTMTMAVIAAHPVVLAIGLIGAASTAYTGYNLARHGATLMKEPAIRQRLNDTMKEAMDLFQEGKMREFLARLSVPYGEEPKKGVPEDPNSERLMDYRSNALYTANPGYIAERLDFHGFRPDGIAYILNNIAEAVTSGRAFDPGFGNDSTYLRSQAKVIFRFIIDNEKLRDSAKALDDKIMEHSFSSMWSNYFHRSKDGTMINDIPASYYQDEEAAPFSARLEEMRNCARLNCAILELINGADEENAFSASVLLKELQQSPNSQFQYFSMNAHRLDTIEDLISAFGVSPDELAVQPDLPSTPANVTHFVHLGGLRRDVIHTIRIPSDAESVTLVDLLSELKLLKIRPGDFTNNLQQFLRVDSMRRHQVLPSPGGVPVIVEAPIGAVASHATRLLTLPEETAIRTLTAAHLRPGHKTSDYFELMSTLFGIILIRCRRGTDGEFIPLDDIRIAEQSIGRTVFLHSPNYRTTRGITQASPTPTSVFIVDPSAAVALPTSELSMTLLTVRNLWFDYGACAHEEGKALALYRIFQCYEKALKLERNVGGVVLSNFSLTTVTTVKPEVVEVYLGLVECRIAMFKLHNAIDLLQSVRKYEQYNTHWKFWYLLAVATRKLCDYRTAKVYINRAAEAIAAIDSSVEGRSEWYLQIVKERSLYKALRDSQLMHSENLLQNVRARFYCALPLNNERRETGFYNVLCMDGGGIKGIIPAMILAEVERRAKLPISHLFDHLAGTSTGAIIAAGLAVPHPDKPGWPRFSAYDVLELYADPTNAGEIFRRANNFTGLFDARFTDEGRINIIRKKYGSANFEDALTNLSIIASDQTANATAIEFNKAGHGKVSLADAVLASSAAPTFFRHYRIAGIEYVDGGLAANNPSQITYNSACKLAHKPIRMWSLGCGDALPDYVDHGDGILHWAAQAPNQAMRAQQLAADKQMAETLGANYTRWNLLYEKHHDLADIAEETLKEYVELAKQFIAENDEQINSMVQELTET